jgi:hypothetical protein
MKAKYIIYLTQIDKFECFWNFLIFYLASLTLKIHHTTAITEKQKYYIVV